MAARAMWKGVLNVGEHRVPVKLYSAVESRRVGFRLLDATDHVPVKQQMVDPATEEEVPREEIRKGIEIDEGVLAVLDPEELASVEPPPSRDVVVGSFVPLSAIDDRWYDRAYWLGPDGDDEAYFALVEALRGTGREGVARWVMRKREYQGSLRIRGDHLTLIRLRHAEEVVPVSALPMPAGRQAEPRELELARQLVSALEGPFDPEEFPETTTDRVRELIAAKAEGRVVKLAAQRKEQASVALDEALRQSLKAVGGDRG